MSKDNLNEDNRKKLRETAQRLGISEDEVFKQIPDIILYSTQSKSEVF